MPRVPGVKIMRCGAMRSYGFHKCCNSVTIGVIASMSAGVSSGPISRFGLRLKDAPSQLRFKDDCLQS